MKKAESAGGIIINQYSEIVMVFTDTKSWQFPKGGVEAGESYIDAALREVEEETGLSGMQLVKQLPMYTRISRDGQTSRDIFYFLFWMEKVEVHPSAEVTECLWVPFEEVESKITYEKDKEFFRCIQEDIIESVSIFTK